MHAKLTVHTYFNAYNVLKINLLILIENVPSVLVNFFVRVHFGLYRFHFDHFIIGAIYQVLILMILFLLLLILFTFFLIVCMVSHAHTT